MGDADTDDASDPEIPLPRRGPRRSQIAQARERLYGEGPDTGDERRGWVGTEHRERSAALAHSVVSRRRQPTEEEPRATATAGPAAASTPSPREPTEQIPTEHALNPSASADAPAASSPDGRRYRVAVVLGLVLAFVAGTGLGLVLTPREAPGPPPLPSRPTLSGDVVGVEDGTTATVLVGNRTIQVAILGLAPLRPPNPGVPAPCGAQTATTFASAALAGHRVTLVPDPLGPEFDAAGQRYAYVVLETQQNYTDLALQQGITSWDTTHALTYGSVFARDQAGARDGSLGIWGAPCHATP